jgi:pSer/pThr/pTyr-binding forkhead associated (FHA) protein
VSEGSGAMEDINPRHELTTTLHLGLRSVADTSPSALIETLIEESSSEERGVISEILQGSGERAMIFIHRGPSRGARFLVTDEGATIGRSPSSEIFLDDVTVSRSHASITRDGDGFTFTDSGSLNGSYINNQQSTTHRLTNGDEIQIGKFHMLFISSTTSGEK